MFLAMLLCGTFVPALLHLCLERFGISCTVLTTVKGTQLFCVEEAAKGISVPAYGVGIEQWAEPTVFPKL